MVSTDFSGFFSPVPDVLRRFREKQIAVTGDLKETFHQITVKEADQDSQLFFGTMIQINWNKIQTNTF